MKVLLVDDEEVCNFINRKIVQRVAQVEQIEIAQNGREALEFFDSSKVNSDGFPDFVLLDLNMPVMGGFDFLERFNGLNLKIKDKITIVVLSSSINQTDVERAKNMGAAHYLTKPLSEPDLKRILAS